MGIVVAVWRMVHISKGPGGRTDSNAQVTRGRDRVQIRLVTM
jgi:hypothetical protein